MIGKVVELTVRGQLWPHLGGTLERVVVGFATGAVLALGLGIGETSGSLQLFHLVILPAALPGILTGIRLGVALSFFVIVISEFIGAEHGLGHLINDGRNFFLVPQMRAAAVVLGLLGYASHALVRLLERRVLRWQSPS